MGATERIVRRLRLRADSEACVRRAALKLENALRCASLPDAGARVLLVRRLDLGRIAASASAQTLSLLLERRVAATGTPWVHGADPNAARAGFVYFRDALEARCALALQLAGSRPSTAWYWPLAVPEFKPAEGAQVNLRRIALTIAALPEAPAALPAWVARLAAAGVATVLDDAIGSPEAATLLRAAHLSGDAPRSRTIRMAPRELPQPVSGARDVGHAEGASRQELAPAFATLSAWVRALACAGGIVTPAWAMVPFAPAAPVAAAVGPTRIGNEQDFQMNGDGGTMRSLAAHGIGATNMHDTPLPGQINEGIASRSGRVNGTASETAFDPALGGRPFPHPAPSAYGGLLFLLPVLQRLGYTAWAEGLPEGAAAQVMREVLASVLRRLQARPDDPAWLLAGATLAEDFPRIDVKAPASWGDPALCAPRGCAANEIVAKTQQTQPVAALAQGWLIVCRRWLRRVAGIGVASLVVRPGAIGLTVTHADIFFRLDSADMRVRRAGLDIDPGWLPWIGRVVAFHYEHAVHA